MEILGIDIGGTGIKGGIVDTAEGRMITERFRVDTPRPATPKAVTKTVMGLIKTFDWSGQVGCAFPARIKGGVVHTATNIDKDFIGMNIASHFSDKSGCEVCVLNDADAAGIAEMRFGAGKGRKDLVILITLGTGIGTAVFIEGVLVPNTELGHIDVKGRAGEKWAAASVRERKDLSWKKYADRLQDYLDRIEFLLAPDLIILGGGLSKPERAKEFVPLLKTEADLDTAILGNSAGIVGAAMYAVSQAWVKV